MSYKFSPKYYTDTDSDQSDSEQSDSPEFFNEFLLNAFNGKGETVSIRIGNRILKFEGFEENLLPEEELREEYNGKLKEVIKDLKNEVSEYKNSIYHTVNTLKRSLKEKEYKLNERLSAEKIMPILTDEDVDNGITVSLSKSGYTWYYKCVYAPKYVNDRLIDPSYARKMVTPIIIKIETDSAFTVTNMRVMKIIGNTKFDHYHGFSGTNRDCWGQLQYQGLLVDTAKKALELGSRAISVLETINEISIAQRSPSPLPRLSTVMSHLVDRDSINNVQPVRQTASQRLSGVTPTSNTESNVWTI